MGKIGFMETKVFKFVISSTNELVIDVGPDARKTFDELVEEKWEPLHFTFLTENNGYSVVMRRRKPSEGMASGAYAASAE